MKKFALTSLILVSASVFAAHPHVYKGWVGDSKCGAKSASVSHHDCAVTCLKGGAAYVFVDDSNKRVFTIDNPEELKGHEGEYIQVTAVIYGDKIHVNAHKELAQPERSEQKDEHH